MLIYSVGGSLYRSRLIKYDVIALQETKGRKETVREIEHNELLIIGAKVENRTIGGVGFLINSTVQHLVDSHESIGPRLAILRLRSKEQGTISIINGCSPTSANETKNEKIFSNFWKRRFERRRATTNSSSATLMPSLARTVTAIGSSDVMALPQGMKMENDCWTSYLRLTRAKISFKKNFKSDTHRPAPHKIPTFKSADLESVIESNTWKLFEDPSEDYDHFVRRVLKCADASRPSQPTTIPRLNAHATALLEKRKAVKLDPNGTHLEKVITGKACRIAIKESLRDYRQTKLLEAAETKSSIERCKRDLNDQRNVVAAPENKEGTMQSSRRVMENMVQQFYTELLRSSTLVQRCPLPPLDDFLPTIESDVAQVMKSMEKGTAPGPDNIPADLLHAGSTALHSVLARHFNHCL
ncbi:hypothetical protein Y032_0236g3230 [Ancylostoma ceylanicum]|uniref:Uncharacterized protein n=1 Tax=Ancylostoma ceylanicum TaxID=53326 RepID=A0A016SEW5_9BILA|nr:hypothetical protein Y032_0236g3230 [Ancylostoma ceylanicum]